MSNRRNIQFTYNPHNKATVLDCNFVVDPTNANGLGVSSFNGSGRISSVFMHTSQTPGSYSNGQLNPNPANGLIIVTLADNYSKYLSFYSAFQSPSSGSNINISTGSSLTLGAVYIIKTLGTTTTAQWQAVGVPSFIQPAIGVSFIAKATSGSGTGVVQAPASGGSGITRIGLIGNPNVMNNNIGANVLGAGVGMQFILGAYSNSAALTMNSYTPAGTNDSATPPIFTGTPAVLTGSVAEAYALAAPAAGTIISLNFYLNDSAQGV